MMFRHTAAAAVVCLIVTAAFAQTSTDNGVRTSVADIATTTADDRGTTDGRRGTYYADPKGRVVDTDEETTGTRAGDRQSTPSASQDGAARSGQPADATHRGVQ